MTEMNVIILEDGTKEDAIRYSYDLSNCGKEELEVQIECNNIFNKVNELEDWIRLNECIGVGCFKKNKRRIRE